MAGNNSRVRCISCKMPQPMDELLNDPTVSDSIKDKIRFIDRVLKKFAIDSLGLKPSKIIPTFMIGMDSPCCAFGDNNWTMYTIGLTCGFGAYGMFLQRIFQQEQRRRHWVYAKAKGYDTDLGDVSTWSALGWFRDRFCRICWKKVILRNWLFWDDACNFVCQK